MNIETVGACEALIKSIKTTQDGGYQVTFEFSSDEQAIISKLIKLYGNNDKLVVLGITRGIE